MLVHVREPRPRVHFSNLERDVDRIFRSFFSDSALPTRGDSQFSVHRDADGVSLTAELPGIEPAAIKIDVDGRTLTISGKREHAERREGVYRLRERRSGDFSSSFHLNATLDQDAVTADYRHGVLTVRIPKRAEAKPRQVTVTSS